MTSENPRPRFYTKEIYSGGRCGTGDGLDIEHHVMIDTDGTRYGEYIIRANDTVIRLSELVFKTIITRASNYLDHLKQQRASE